MDAPVVFCPQPLSPKSPTSNSFTLSVGCAVGWPWFEPCRLQLPKRPRLLQLALLFREPLSSRRPPSSYEPGHCVISLLCLRQIPLSFFFLFVCFAILPLSNLKSRTSRRSDPAVPRESSCTQLTHCSHQGPDDIDAKALENSILSRTSDNV